MTKREGAELLGYIRNLLSPQIWLLVADDCWHSNELIGLGFQRDNTLLQHEKLHSYQYNLASYNFKRTWNNPKNWANPENWGKFRW